ncbi:MAG TPA: Gfo/Idh/MocA family oxidoreductase [Terriglobia bacterium]|nr:Gfo/Idh/MocA family oxidoreductase [Terriglobia bacterium]
MHNRLLSRREFMRAGAGSTVAGSAAGIPILKPRLMLQASPRVAAPSDRVRLAAIGTGVRGCTLIRTALSCPGAEIVAACDLYDGRLMAAKECANNDIFTTKDYRAILDRQDVDAVFVATPDHWHAKIVQEVCAAGKDVYCEKAMSHTVEQGFAMVEAMQTHKRIVQVGSQRAISVLYSKAKEIYDSGVLGRVTAIEAWLDINNPSGAWVYPIPPDASEQTIDWKQFLGSAPVRPFDPKRFFRWRCYRDYGEGLPGDIYVHMLTGIHFIAGISAPPVQAGSMGGLFQWTDDREVPDLMWTLYDYQGFRVSVRSNLNNASIDVTRFFGTKGTLEIRGAILTFVPQDTKPRPEGYSILGWPKKLREDYLREWHAEHPEPVPGQDAVATEAQSFKAPDGYDDTRDHINNFLESVRTRQSPVEDAVFGNNTALACHMANESYLKKTAASWDATTRRITA